MTHIKQSGNYEWYTPSVIIEAARTAMGGIDLDPASCAEANEIVRAARYFSEEDDGLKKKWGGRVWLNPPYARGLVEQFINKLLAERWSCISICVLVNNATETAWCQRLLNKSVRTCFLSKRIRYWRPGGSSSGSPVQGQLVAYMGCEAFSFIEAFRPLGVIL